MGARKVAAFIVLFTSISMFFLEGFSEFLFGVHLSFDKPAWAFLALAAYVLFGINLTDLLQGRREKDPSDE